MSTRLQLSGIGSLQRSLRRLAATMPLVTSEALATAAGTLEVRVAEEAPVDTGALEASVAAHAYDPVRGRCSAAVLVGEPYGVPVDLGTHDTEADDFLQRAFDEVGPRAADRAAAAIVQGIERNL